MRPRSVLCGPTRGGTTEGHLGGILFTQKASSGPAMAEAIGSSGGPAAPTAPSARTPSRSPLLPRGPQGLPSPVQPRHLDFTNASRTMGTSFEGGSSQVSGTAGFHAIPQQQGPLHPVHPQAINYQQILDYMNTHTRVWAGRTSCPTTITRWAAS
jgi:hypothetical protein